MPAPALKALIDWNADGDFGDSIEDLDNRVLGITWTRGRSADFSAEATGSATITLRNDDDLYTPDRNWLDNPSIEIDTTGWTTTPIRGNPGTSVARVTGDGAPGAGSACLQAVIPATIFSGVGYHVPYQFLSGITYSLALSLRSISGTTSLLLGIAALEDNTDFAETPVTITTGWTRWTLTWTPSANREGAGVHILTNAASAAELKIDAVQVNSGSAANTYVEAPTRGQLVPGRPVRLYATYSAVEYPLFFGYIERLSYDPKQQTCTITAYDPLRRYQETDVVVPSNTYVSRSARDMRIAVLEDVERGDWNLLPNPSFETDISSWTNTTFTLTRVTGDAAFGSACAELVAASVNTRAITYARLAPVAYEGVPYRFSVYLRQTSGSGTWYVRLGTDIGGAYASRLVTVGTSWERFSVSYTPTVTVGNGGSTPLVAWVESTGAGTVRIDAASLTRGVWLLPYSDLGTSGRWPNWVGNGGFGGATLNGWLFGYKNLVGNPSFETNTTGWSVAGDAFTAAATSITRVTSEHTFGAASALVDVPGSAGNWGTFSAMSGTFKSGRTYDIHIAIKLSAGLGSGPVIIGAGSQGTPADKTTLSSTTVNDSGWTVLTRTWTPSADRTDAHLFAYSGINLDFYLDGAMVTLRDSTEGAAPSAYFDTGPGGGLEPATSHAISETIAKYGSRSLEIVTPATALAGIAYDFGHWEPYFISGRAYTVSAWVRVASGTGSIKVGIGAAKTDGTIDEASATNAAVGTTFTEITATWTPSADYATAGRRRAYVYVAQTDATARTIYVDGVRVIPEATADDFEMSHWSLSSEPDVYSTSASLSGSALSALSTLNGLALSRHWIEPTVASPWYQYATAGRDDAKTSVETYNDDLQDMSVADIDRASIVNVVAVRYAGGTEYYSDPASVAVYGLRPGGAVGSTFLPDLTIPDAIVAALFARYKDPRARPEITVENRWPSQLQRELDDLVTINFVRLGIQGGRYLILRLTTIVTSSGKEWRTVYALEEVP